jgi:glycerol uptake facilitator-like aquaporin
MLKQIDWATASYYVAGQIFGSLMGSLMLWLCWFALVPTGSQLGATVLNEDTSVWQALSCELVLSFIFHSVLLGFYVVPNNSEKNEKVTDDDGDSESVDEKNDNQYDNEEEPNVGQELKTLESFMNTHDTGMMSLYVAIVLAACLVMGVTVSGGSLNPARSFGPAVVSGVWYNHWIYWAGPCGGAALAALLVGAIQH